MKLRIWWIPQIPMKPFFKEVPTLAAGKLLLDALADYDLFQLENNVKPDYSNAGGLQAIADGEWVDWYDEDGYDIDEYEFDDSGELVLAWELEEGNE